MWNTVSIKASTSSCNHALHLAAEVPVTAEPHKAAQHNAVSAPNADAGELTTSSSSNSEGDTHDARVPLDTIKKQLVLEEIARSGEMGGTTYE